MLRTNVARPPGVIVTGVFVCLLLLAGPCAGQASLPTNEEPQNAVQWLAVGHPAEGSVAQGQTHVYGLDLSNGQFVLLSVAASNVQLTIVGPDGAKVVALSTPTCGFPLYFLPALAGVYRLQVSSPSGASSATYKVEVDELRGATEHDRIRAAAGQALLEAYRISSQDSPAAQPQAADKYQEAVSLFRRADDRRGEALVYQVRSCRSRDARDYQAAADYLRRAQALWHALDRYDAEAGVLLGISGLLGRLGKTQEALACLNAALPLLRALGDHRGEAEALTSRGDFYDLTGEFQNALNDKQQALSILQAGKWWEQELTVLVDLGQIYEEMGQAQIALRYNEQGLNLARSHGSHDLEINLLALVAGTYAQAGDKDKALEYYNQAVALSQGDPHYTAWMRQNVGTFYVQQGEYGKGVQVLEQILPYFHTKHSLVFEASTLYWMSVAYHRQGKLQQALEALSQALSIWSLKNQLRRSILREIGSVYEDSGDSSKAREYYEKSLLESRDAKDPQAEALALVGMAHAERSLKQLAEARRVIEEGLTILESVRAQIAGPESRSSYFALAQEHYGFYIDLLMQIHAEHPDQGFDAAALQASERARARSLLDMLAEAHTDIHQGADPKLLERERELQWKLRARSKYQVQLLMKQHAPEEARAVTVELQALTAEYDETEAQIRSATPRYAALTQLTPLDLKEIQERVLDPDTLLLEYALGESRSYLWAVTTSTLTSFTLPKRAEIERAARRVYQLLTVRNAHPKGEREPEREARIARARAEYPSAAAHLSEMVLGPAVGLLGYKRLVIVSDGVLQYIPFAALPVPVPKAPRGELRQPLVVKSEIVTLPSASAIAVLRRDLAGRPPAPKAVAVLADPVFDEQDPRVTAHQEVSQARHRSGVAAPALPPDLQRSWADTLTSQGSWKIGRLPFSRREADAISRDAPPGSSLKAVDFRASRATATSPELAQYRVIHFGTHGVFNSRTPALSGIVLSLVDERGKAQDGFLRLGDIYNLHLPADLVVLSACQTALGQDIKGEGLVGLTRGFMYAGAARVMASLWQIDDVATAELMSHFYQGVLKQNLQPATALRAAQVYMWKQKRWQGDPYFWGAFQLQGEWK